MYKIRDNYILKNTKDGILLIDVNDNSNLFHLNLYGAFILKNIDIQKDVIIDMLHKKFLIDKNKLSFDYENFIKILLKNNILEVLY
jgi:hypothetical protein